MGNVCQAGDQSPCQSIISPKIKEALQGTQYGPLLLYFSHVSRNNKVKTVCCWVILSHAKVKLDAHIFYLFSALISIITIIKILYWLQSYEM
jgi:hypothetical protein